MQQRSGRISEPNVRLMREHLIRGLTSSLCVAFTVTSFILVGPEALRAEILHTEMTGSTPWTIETVDSIGSQSWSTSIAVDSKSSPHIGYYDAVNGDLKYATKNESTWRTQIVDSYGDAGEFASIGLDNSDYPRISYYEEWFHDFKYARWNGTAWVVEVVDSAGDVGYFSSLVMDSTNRAHTSYYDWTNDAFVYARREQIGWIRDSMCGLPLVPAYSSIAVDNSDKAYVGIVYWEGASLDWHLYFGPASCPNQVVATVGEVGGDVSLAIDSGGVAHIAYTYYDGTNHHALRYARKVGNVWDIQTVDSGNDVGATMSMVLDSSGFPHLAYGDETTGCLKYARWNGTGWRLQEIECNGVGASASIAIDTRGRVHVSYIDRANGTLKYAVGTANNAPGIPFTPSGPTVGIAGVPYTYLTSGTDPDGDRIKYTFNWGDGNTSVSFYADSGAPVAQSHAWTRAGTYEVRAMATDNRGATSAWTGPLMVTIREPPDSPRNLVASPADGQVSLSWMEPGRDGGSPITNYTIYRGLSPNAEVFLATVGLRLTYVDAGLTNGQSYYYKVSARNGIGEGPKSNEVSATPAEAPSEPLNIEAVGYDRRIGLSWSPPLSNGGSPIINYIVYRGATSNGESFLVTLGCVLNYVDAGLTNGVVYYYRVSAVNAVEEGPKSEEANAIPRGPPGPPVNLVVTDNIRRIAIAWSPPLDDGGSSITNYIIYRGTIPGSGTFLDKIGGVLVYTDINVANGLTYYYKVSAKNAIGEGPKSNEANATPTATIPGPPTNLSVTDVINDITLTWSPPLNDGGYPIMNYTVYRSVNGLPPARYVVLGNTSTYIDAAVAYPSIYSYAVSANNLLGEGPLSNMVSATPVLPPSASNIFEVVSGNRQITLKWTEPFESNGAPVTNYSLYRGTSSNGEMFLATRARTGQTETFVDAGLVNGQTYYYYVTAWNLAGEGAMSSEVNATPGAVPGVPTGLAAMAGDEQVTLTWSAPVDSGGFVITNYSMYRSTVPGAESFVRRIGSQTSYVDAGLTNGVVYYYQVAAVNAVGEGAKSTEVNAVPATTPSEPLGFRVFSGDHQVVLTWTAPSSNGGLSITNYQLYRGTVSGGETFFVAVGNVLIHTDNGVVNGQTYCYQVTAKNPVGEGPASNEACAIPSTFPGPPIGLAAMAGNEQVELTWSAPTDDGGSPVTNYMIYRGLTPGSELFLVETGNTLFFLDTNVTNGETYFYKVSAKNIAGEGPQSNEANATPVTTPSEPLIVWIGSGWDSSKGGIGTIELYWLAPATDGGSPITHYRVYRGTEPGVLTLLEEIGNLLDYNDTSVVPSQTYYYRVSAVNAVGEGPNSTEANATLEPRNPPPGPTKSIFEEPWFWAIVAVVIIILVSLFVLILRRKKGKQEKGESPEKEEQTIEKENQED